MLKKWQEVGLARAQIKIRDVKDGILVLPDRRYRVLLKTSAVNFGLKGESEQEGLIQNFQKVLNSISSPIQILVRTRKMDVERYLERLKQQEKDEPEPVYQQQIRRYRDFIRQKIEKSRILSRRFYVIIPYDAQTQQEEIEITMRQHPPRNVHEFSQQQRLTEEDTVFEAAKRKLEALSVHWGKELWDLGIRAERLTTEEILELFYTCFNPGEAIGKTLKQRLQDEEVSAKLKVN